MSADNQIIYLDNDNTLCFGDYKATEKQKADKFEWTGDVYKLKTHNQVTRLEKNGNLLFESVPGAKVSRFSLSEKAAVFEAEGAGDTQITMELEPEEAYRVFIDGVNVGNVHSNLSGKVNFSLQLDDAPVPVKVEKA